MDTSIYMANQMDNLIQSGIDMNDEMERLRVFESRWKELHANPSGMRHLLNLLHLGKGSHDDFDGMVDRIIASRSGATKA